MKRITRATAKKLLEEMTVQGDIKENEGVPKPGEEASDTTPEKWLQMFNTLNTMLSSLQMEIRDLKEVKSQVETYSVEWKESIEKGLADSDLRIDKHEFQVKLLMNMVINQDERIWVMEDRITAAFQREIKANVIIHGLVEQRNETREELLAAVESFFKETMEIEQKIEVSDVYRLGQGSVRPLLTKLKYPNDKALILSNTSKLHKKQNAKKKSYFVHEDLSDEQTEIQKLYKDLIMENRTKEEKEQLKIKMQRGRIAVNSETVKPKVKPPLKSDILCMTDDELDTIRSIKLLQGPDHTEKGLDYQIYVLPVKTTHDVNKAYTKLRIKHADATHISCAYRLTDPTGPYRQEMIDDKDFGIGRSMMKILKEREIT